jgi:hypothetical protein
MALSPVCVFSFGADTRSVQWWPCAKQDACHDCFVGAIGAAAVEDGTIAK